MAPLISWLRLTLLRTTEGRPSLLITAEQLAFYLDHAWLQSG